MNARRQVARLVPLAALVLLAAVGLRGGFTGLSWSGPLRSQAVIVGAVLEVILATLLVVTLRRGRAARLREETATGAAGPSGDDERDIAGALRYLLRYLLVAAMIAIGVTALLSRSWHLGSARQVTFRPVTLRPVPSATPSARARVTVPAVSLPDLMYAVLILALVACLVAAAWWLRRARAGIALLPAAAGEADGEDPEALRAAVESGRAAMAGLDDARTAIIACYEAMERSLAERGAARGAAGTPAELLRRALDARIIAGDGARRLTVLFYEARFSTHDLGPGNRDAAIAALDDLAAELGDRSAGVRS